MNSAVKRHTLSVLVNNKSGVLMRIVSLFSRRGYNIDSLSVGETEKEGKSRITIVVCTDDSVVQQIIRQLGKLIDVTNVFELKKDESVQSELLLIKVQANEKQRTAVIELSELFHAKIVDVTASTITMQVTGAEDKLSSLLKLVKTYGIVELSRTGVTAVQRGENALESHSLEDVF